jgi:diaminohydroxyphosphoribosylaminopyrimidine deaminase/5-amino-6-(5-phosphoribosylamino)uracil reductase
MGGDEQHMARAIELARRGEGFVEPNPMVGCVLVRDGACLGEGWHRGYGGPHAEIEALRSCRVDPAGATLYVTLEPCCHHGKTPPCTDAILRAGIARVVVGQVDPFPAVAGRGLELLRQAGVWVDVGVLAEAAAALVAPFRMLVALGRPWILAKWAMTLDGKLASRTGHSRWISNERSRELTHHLRGRVDAIMVGRHTADIDDPLLTARPAGPRQATRIVVDTLARLSPHSQLVQTARTTPVLIATGETADPDRRQVLEDAGCEVLVCPGADPAERLEYLVFELGRRRWTNLLVEGGSRLLGSLFDRHWIDEVHVFLAPKLVGGEMAPGPVAGQGLAEIPPRASLTSPHIELLGEDVYISGRLLNAWE